MIDDEIAGYLKLKNGPGAHTKSIIKNAKKLINEARLRERKFIIDEIERIATDVISVSSRDYIIKAINDLK